LLCTVVKVSLEAPPFVVAGLHDSRARRPKLGELRAQLSLEPFVFECEPRGGAGCLNQTASLEEHGIVHQRRDRSMGRPEHRDRAVRG
jgi:hypothetical protein